MGTHFGRQTKPGHQLASIGRAVAGSLPYAPLRRDRRWLYEWTGQGQGRQPYWFHRPDNALIVLAGLWQWQEVKEEPAGFFQVFAIITTRANDVMAPIHDRMPVVIDKARLDIWMNVASTDLAPIRSMLAPAADDWLVADRASPLVNNVRNDGPELLAPETRP
jgi:putative SOS response-associated peptidase YedK